MQGERTKLQISMPAEPMSVRLLRSEVLRWLREQGERSERLASAIALATSEAAANVVRHAYRGSRGRVDLDARVAGEEIVIEIRDSGTGLAAGARKPTVYGGMGLPLIDEVADAIALYSDDGGTSITMRFDLSRRTAGWPESLPAEPVIRLH